MAETVTPKAPAPTPDEVAAKKASQIIEADVAEAARPVQPGNFTMTAKGDEFLIEGSGFGGQAGTVTVGGRQVPTTRWHDSRICGVLPTDIKGGDVLVHAVTGSFRGSFGK